MSPIFLSLKPVARFLPVYDCPLSLNLRALSESLSARPRVNRKADFVNGLSLSPTLCGGLWTDAAGGQPIPPSGPHLP